MTQRALKKVCITSLVRHFWETASCEVACARLRQEDSLHSDVASRIANNFQGEQNITFKYSLENDSLILIEGMGAVTVLERIGLVAEIFADQSLPKIANILILVSGVTNAPTTDEVTSIGRLISRLIERFSSTKIAIVNNRVGHATISHLIATTATGEVNAFQDENKARAWLGVL